MRPSKYREVGQDPRHLAAAAPPRREPGPDPQVVRGQVRAGGPHQAPGPQHGLIHMCCFLVNVRSCLEFLSVALLEVLFRKEHKESTYFVLRSQL